MTNSQPLLRKADTFSELKAQLTARLKALQKRLAELEQRQQETAPAAHATDVVPPDVPATLRAGNPGRRPPSK